MSSGDERAAGAVRHHEPRLVALKLLHTAIWAVMVGCIGGIFLFARAGRPRLALAMIAVVAGEVAVLALNRWTCPLTPIAARWTDDRAPNFDIYLPAWLARWNKEIFGTLYVVGTAYALLRWLATA